MNPTVENFYNKEDNSEYYLKYEREHAPRLDFIVRHFELDKVKDKAVADFGCGYGFFLKRLDDSNKKIGYDGMLPQLELLCKMGYMQLDLEELWSESDISDLRYDMSFCFETLEHVASPYNVLCNIKLKTQENAPIYISIPDERVTHNVVYPGLMFPHTNFEEFLEQMALPIQEHVVFEGNWPAQIWRCKNAPWSEKKLKYPKSEEKFRDASPLESTNL